MLPLGSACYVAAGLRGSAGVWFSYGECLCWGEMSEKLQNVIGSDAQ